MELEEMMENSTSLERSNNVINSFNSHQCQRFYNEKYFQTFEDTVSCGDPISKRATIKKCPKANNTFWFKLLDNEDYRWTCKEDIEVIHHRDVMIDHLRKIIFVNVTKSASSTIRSILHKRFGLTEEKNQKSLKDDVKNIEEYFIFSFVRDPLKRLESGMGQTQREGIKLGHPELLNSLSDGCVLDKHLWSTARYLNVRQKGGNLIKYDFIGSLEHIDEDIAFLLPILLMNPNARKAAMQNTLKIEKAFQVRHVNRGAHYFHSALKYNTAETKEKVCKIVEHDYVCLGSLYKKPNFC